jgi:hypothetical protein
VLLVEVCPILKRALTSWPPRFDAATLRAAAIELVAETKTFDTNNDDADGRSWETNRVDDPNSTPTVKDALPDAFCALEALQPMDVSAIQIVSSQPERPNLAETENNPS